MSQNRLKKTFQVIVFIIYSILYSTSVFALSSIAEEGKKYFVICDACHNPKLEPAKAAPMFGVQRRYKRAYGSKESVINHIVSFAKQPSLEKALMKNAVKHLGLMPAIVLPDETLNQIANYIVEESFAPPCKHWEMAIIKLGNDHSQARHIEKDKRMYNRFCR